MRKILFIFLLAILVNACNTSITADKPRLSPLSIVEAENISVPVYDFDGLKPLFDIEDDTLRIFNFWATWCVPCVKELPHFERVNDELLTEKIKVILISLDFYEDIETALIPFINDNELSSQVLLLDDPDANRWIPLVHESWDGAIPVSLFKHGGEESFVAKPMGYEELIVEINKYLKHK